MCSKAWGMGPNSGFRENLFTGSGPLEAAGGDGGGISSIIGGFLLSEDHKGV